MIANDYGIDVHPDADKYDPGKWDKPGRCICGEPLPPRGEWVDASNQWAHVHCPACGRMYVDEDEFDAIYDEPEECERCGIPEPDET